MDWLDDLWNAISAPFALIAGDQPGIQAAGDGVSDLGSSIEDAGTSVLSSVSNALPSSTEIFVYLFLLLLILLVGAYIAREVVG